MLRVLSLRRAVRWPRRRWCSRCSSFQRHRGARIGFTVVAALLCSPCRSPGCCRCSSPSRSSWSGRGRPGTGSPAGSPRPPRPRSRRRCRSRDRAPRRTRSASAAPTPAPSPRAVSYPGSPGSEPPSAPSYPPAAPTPAASRRRSSRRPATARPAGRGRATTSTARATASTRATGRSPTGVRLRTGVRPRQASRHGHRGGGAHLARRRCDPRHDGRCVALVLARPANASSTSSTRRRRTPTSRFSRSDVWRSAGAPWSSAASGRCRRSCSRSSRCGAATRPGSGSWSPPRWWPWSAWSRS